MYSVCVFEYIGYTDGGVRGGNPGVAGWGYYLLHNGEEIARDCAVIPAKRSNNYAEYAALYKLLDRLRQEKITGAQINCDSQLVVKQVNGIWSVNCDEIRALWLITSSLKHSLGVTLNWVPREKNTLADKIVETMLDKHTGVNRNGKKVRNN